MRFRAVKLAVWFNLVFLSSLLAGSFHARAQVQAQTQIQVQGQRQGQLPPARDREVEQFLQRFRADTKQTMLTHPDMWNARTGEPLYVPADPNKHEHFLDHLSTIAKIRARALPPSGRQALAVIDSKNDDPAKMVEQPELLAYTLEEMEQSKMLSGQSMVDAWSGHYWPYYLGVAAYRYADPLFPESDDWSVNHKYVLSPGHTLLEVLARNMPIGIDQLSPAEKYDIITGNYSGALTPAMWTATGGMQDSDGNVSSWQGICEGWSSAAIRVARPDHTVTVKDPSGRAITFYPSDVKALSSLLWAWGKLPTRMVGGHCQEEEPETDSNGRITNEDCFESNPATWHLITTHQLGRLHHPFILDAADNNQIWNQPAQGYVYSYFNPQTGLAANNIAAAKVQIADYTSDPFKSYRAANAVAVVGIAMDFTYVSENEAPTQAPSDSPQQDTMTTVRYVYDLELDSNNKIVGGEWYHNDHPNFLWMPEPGATASSVAEDAATGTWTGDGPVPPSWTQAAATAATSGQGQPLAKVVEVLESLASH